MRRVFNVDFIKNIYVQVIEKDKMKTAEDEIKEYFAGQAQAEPSQ